jgi:hypothetical protein
MTGHAIPIKGYRLKDGRLVKCIKHLDASAKARRRGGSKKITVKRKTAQTPI